MQFNQTLNGSTYNDTSLAHKGPSQQAKTFPININNSNNYYYPCLQNPNIFQSK